MTHDECCPSLFYPHPGSMRSDARIVILSDREVDEARAAARTRLEAAAGMRERGGAHDRSKLASVELGALGEMAVARITGYPFDPKPFGLDVGPFEVRTRGRHDYELPIRREDREHHPDVPFILVTAGEPWSALIVRGWRKPNELLDEWVQAWGRYGLPQHYVPQAALHDLRKIVRK